MDESIGLTFARCCYFIPSELLHRDRLRGEWGVAEVADAARTVQELGERGLIDPARATIRGGSAGKQGLQKQCLSLLTVTGNRRVHCAHDSVHSCDSKRIRGGNFFLRSLRSYAPRSRHAQIRVSIPVQIGGRNAS